MCKTRTILWLATILLTQQVFAKNMTGDHRDMLDTKPCAAIADACAKAGFASAEKPYIGLWQDCMKPIIHGQKVAGVTVSAKTVKACRTDKIAEFKKELKQLQKVK